MRLISKDLPAHHLRGYTGSLNFFGSALVNSSVKPDFSGEWVLDRQASHLTGGASAMETGVLRIDHRDPKCSFQISMSVGGESVELAWESVSVRETPLPNFCRARHSGRMAETTVPQAHAPSLRDTWQDRIAEQARSGLSIKQFCKDRGIPEHCFYAWRRRLRPAVPVRFALVDRTVAGSATEQP